MGGGWGGPLLILRMMKTIRVMRMRMMKTRCVCGWATVDTRGTEMSDGCNKVSIENSQDLSSTFDQQFLWKKLHHLFRGHESPSATLIKTLSI